MALKVGELFASFNLDTSGIAGAVSSAEKQLSNLGKGLMVGGAAATAAMTVPIANAAKAVFNAGTDFDAQMSRVFAIAGASSEETMDALRQKALEMGSTTQFTASEAGEAMEYMAMAGWKTEQMLAAVGPLMSLAAAAGEELGTTSDIVTDAMTAFGLSAEGTTKVIKDGMAIEVNNVAHFADVLAAVSSNANTNVSMMGESFKYVGAIAGSMGYSVEDTAVALGIMANSGIKASQAGTTLRRIMTSLNGNVEISGKNIGKVAIQTSNADGTMRSFSEILADCRKAFAGLTESEKSQAAKNLVGQNAMSGFLTLMNASEEELRQLTGAIEGCTGSAEDMATTMLDNAKGDVTLFKSALEGLEITLWKLAENGFRGTVKELTRWADAFRNADRTTQLGTLRMAGLAAAIGPVMTGMGGMITVLPKVPKLLMGIAGPAGLVTLGLVALGAAAVDSDNTIGKTFVKTMRNASVSVQKFAYRVKESGPTLKANMAAFIESAADGIELGMPKILAGFNDIVITGISAISNSMPDIASAARRIVTTIANSLKTNLSDIAPAAVQLVTNIGAAVIENVPTMLDAGIKLFQGLLEGLGEVEWGQIGTKIHTAVTTALSEIRTNIFTLVFGEEPEDGTLGSWGQLGARLVQSIKDGITEAAKNGKDLLGGLVLGSDYQPDDSWGTVAQKIWEKIRTTLAGLLGGAADLVKGMVLGDDYTPDASWKDVANKIWQVIRDAFTALKTNTKDLIGNLALGDVYTADTSWSTIGSAIWAKIQEGIAAGKALIDTIMEKIGSIEIDASKITTLVSNAGQFVSSLAGKLLAGKIEWRAKMIGFASQIVRKIADFDWSSMGSTLGKAIGGLVTALAGAIPTAINAAGELMNVGLVIASGLVDTIVGAFDSATGADLNIGGIVQSLITNITDLLPKAFELGGKVISAGAYIAQKIFTSIAEALKNASLSGVAEDLGSAATELLKSLFQNAAGLKDNPEISAFLTNIGTAIMDGLGALGTIVGDFAGKLLAYLFSEEGLTDIYNAGTTIVNLLLEGMSAGISGVLNFVGNMIDQILIEFGLVDPEARAAMQESGVQLAAAMTAGMNSELANSMQGDTLLTLMDYFLTHGGQGTQFTAADYLGDELATINMIMDSASKDAAGSAEAFRDAVFEGLLESKAMDRSLWESLGIGIGLDDAGDFWDAVDAAVADYDNAIDYLKSRISMSDMLPEDLDFWGAILEAMTADGGPDYVKLMDLMTAQGVALFGEAADAADAAAAQQTEKIKEAEAKLWTSAADSVAAGAETALSAAEASGNAIAAGAMATALADGAQPVQTAALQLGDAAVKQFLLTMSAENGQTIAQTFISGMIAILEDGSLIAAVTTLANSVYSTMAGAVNTSAGYGIGQNFGAGLAGGINSMAVTVSTVAWNLGITAADALSRAIQEGSPSKLTAASGANFGLGFINSITDSIRTAGAAARMMGTEAVTSLERSVSGLQSMAVNGMAIPAGGHVNAYEQQNAAADRSAQLYADAIARALANVRVEMNGEDVGRLVMPAVSEGIAYESEMRRHGAI